jgi:hypothetical protein
MSSQVVFERRASRQETDCGLNVAVVYQDEPTRQWAREVCERVGKLLGNDAVRSTWWKMSGLTEPAVLAGAVSVAIRADVVIIAIHASEGLPLPFYVWTEAWLPHRAGAGVALVALITIPERPSLQMDRAREYLRTAARQGRFDFLLEERKLGAGKVGAESGGLRARPGPAESAASSSKKLLSYASRRWRLNEERLRSGIAA